MWFSFWILFEILIPDFTFFVITQVNLKYFHLCQCVSKFIAATYVF